MILKPNQVCHQLWSRQLFPFLPRFQEEDEDNSSLSPLGRNPLNHSNASSNGSAQSRASRTDLVLNLTAFGPATQLSPHGQEDPGKENNCGNQSGVDLSQKISPQAPATPVSKRFAVQGRDGERPPVMILPVSTNIKIQSNNGEQTFHNLYRVNVNLVIFVNTERWQGMFFHCFCVVCEPFWQGKGLLVRCRDLILADLRPWGSVIEWAWNEFSFPKLVTLTTISFIDSLDWVKPDAYLGRGRCLSPVFLSRPLFED